MKSNNSEKQISAREKVRSPLGVRIDEALGDKTPAWLARECGLSSGTMSEIRHGQMPGADKAVRIAQVLKVPVEWLISGGPRRSPGFLVDVNDADWVLVPRYNLDDFTPAGKPEPAETIPIRKDWLNQRARTAKGLWLTAMPASGFPHIAAEDEPIFCQDAPLPLSPGFYLWENELGRIEVQRLKPDKMGYALDNGAQAEPYFHMTDNADRSWVGGGVVARIIGKFKLQTI